MGLAVEANRAVGKTCNSVTLLPQANTGCYSGVVRSGKGREAVKWTAYSQAWRYCVMA